MQGTGSTRRHFLAAAASTLAVAGFQPQAPRSGFHTSRGARIVLGAEVARLRRELEIFGRCYLPRLLAGRVLAYHEGAARLIVVPEDPGRLRAWQAAVDRLVLALPGTGPDGPGGDPDPAEFGDLLTDPGAGDWAPGPARIDWRLSPLPEPWPEHREDVARVILGQANLTVVGADPHVEQLRFHRLAVRRWFLALPINRRLDPGLPAALLPVLAEADPAFARRAIDPLALEAAVRADRSLTPSDVSRYVGYFRGYFYRSAVSSALARVLAALANNRFDEIGRFLDLPEVHGNWKGAMPRFVFAVLLGKVTVLRGLARSDGLGTGAVSTVSIRAEPPHGAAMPRAALGIRTKGM